MQARITVWTPVALTSPNAYKSLLCSRIRSLHRPQMTAPDRTFMTGSDPGLAAVPAASAWRVRLHPDPRRRWSLPVELSVPEEPRSVSGPAGNKRWPAVRTVRDGTGRRWPPRARKLRTTGCSTALSRSQAGCSLATCRRTGHRTAQSGAVDPGNQGRRDHRDGCWLERAGEGLRPFESLPASRDPATAPGSGRRRPPERRRRCRTRTGRRRCGVRSRNLTVVDAVRFGPEGGVHKRPPAHGRRVTCRERSTRVAVTLSP